MSERRPNGRLASDGVAGADPTVVGRGGECEPSSCLSYQRLKLGRACAGGVAALLVGTDGWNASPNRIRRAFRKKVKAIGQRWSHGGSVARGGHLVG